MQHFYVSLSFFFFNDTATTEIYTLSLHDALPIWISDAWTLPRKQMVPRDSESIRSEEHTSELQSRFDLVCRLLLEKKKQLNDTVMIIHDTIHLHLSYHDTFIR